MKQTDQSPQLKRIQNNALLIGAVGLVIGLGGAYLNPQAFFQSYLLGFMFWLSIALGHIAILLIHHLVGGKWAFVIRRFMETGATTIPLLAILFVPILIGIPYLYTWADPTVVAESHVLQQKASWWLNVPFFVTRSVIYFAVWIVLGYLLSKWSLEQDKTGDPEINNRLKSLSGLGIILAVLTATFAAFDWMMSITPLWYSSMYGVIYMAGEAIVAIATGILLARYFARRDETFAAQADIYLFNDLANFLLAFISFWAYVSFSQYLILWSANLPETITWYVARLNNGWQVPALLLVFLGFALPFVILLGRKFKRNLKMVMGLAVLALVMHFVDLFWIIMPSFYTDGFYFHWMNLVVPVGIGGLWVAFYVRQLPGKSLLPLHDTRFQTEADKHTHSVKSHLQEV
jgi:hypothetical protein